MQSAARLPAYFRRKVNESFNMMAQKVEKMKKRIKN